MTVHDRIEINPKIMLGKPVIRGTRIPVELIVRKMAEGADEKTLLQASSIERRGIVTRSCALSPTRIATFR